MNKKLTCKEVKQIVGQFFKAIPSTEIAEEFGVSVKTITNIMYRIYYTECYNPLSDFSNLEVYFDAVKGQMELNRRRAKGRGVRK